MGKKVLLVADDIEMSRKVVQRFLKNEYEVLEAEDGLQVLEILQHTHVDGLLLDIIMPGLDGLEVLKRVRASAEWKDIGILVASSTKEKTERTALSLGADDIVSKPYDPIVIQKRLENIFAAREGRLKKNAAQQSPAALEQQNLRELSEKAAEITDAIHRIADIVQENGENPMLLKEAATQLHRKANQLSVLFPEA